MAQFLIRTLRYEDIPELICLPQSEGREMGLEPEIRSWLNFDSHGIIIAVSSEDGRIAGCCGSIVLSSDHGYIGMFVVRQKYRGIGLGRILWNSAVSRLGNRNISLSSGDQMLSFYTEKGFSLSANWTIDLYIATYARLPAESLTSNVSAPYVILVDPLGPLVEWIIEYDGATHKYDRSGIIKETVSETGTLTLISVKQTPGVIKTSGYACMKKSLQGHWLIAPVYADDYLSAYCLIHGLLSRLNDCERNEGVVAKLISSNLEAAKIFLQFGMIKSSYQLKRLSTKKIFPIPETKIFALQSSVFCTE